MIQLHYIKPVSVFLMDYILISKPFNRGLEERIDVGCTGYNELCIFGMLNHYENNCTLVNALHRRSVQQSKVDR